jgi:hypothetical protein
MDHQREQLPRGRKDFLAVVTIDGGGATHSAANHLTSSSR